MKRACHNQQCLAGSARLSRLTVFACIIGIVLPANISYCGVACRSPVTYRSHRECRRCDRSSSGAIFSRYCFKPTSSRSLSRVICAFRYGLITSLQYAAEGHVLLHAGALTEF